MPRSLKPTSMHRPDRTVLSQLLRELRLAAGLTQAQAADGLGLSQTGISDIETNDRGVELLVARDLVRLYGGDWLAFVAELERRIAAQPKPASALIVKKSKAQK